MMLRVCHLLLCWLCISNASHYYYDPSGHLPPCAYGYSDYEYTFECTFSGLTEFPSGIGDSTTSIDVSNNNIASFEHNALTNLSNVEFLTISANPFTQLPNLQPVGKTLSWLVCSECQLTFIDPQMFSELVVLDAVIFSVCQLTSFPNVAAPTVTYIALELNQLTSTPCVDKYTALDSISLDGNPISDSGEDPCVPVTTVSIDVQTTPEPYITNFTNVSLRQLEDLTVISVPNEMTTVPLTCPRHDVFIGFSGPDPAVSLCTCDNVWLKAVDGQRGSLDMADKTCGAAVTTQQLLQQECQRPRTGKLTMMNLEKSYDNFFCSFPIAKYLTNVSVQRCGMVCIKTLGCSGFNFRETTRPMIGDCAIVAPTDSAITDIPDQDSPEWTYWTERK